MLKLQVDSPTVSLTVEFAVILFDSRTGAVVGTVVGIVVTIVVTGGAVVWTVVVSGMLIWTIFSCAWTSLPI